MRLLSPLGLQHLHGHLPLGCQDAHPSGEGHLRGGCPFPGGEGSAGSLAQRAGRAGSVPRAGRVAPGLGGGGADALPRAGAGAAPGPGRLGGEDARAERCLREDPSPPPAQARGVHGSAQPRRGERLALAGPEQVSPEKRPQRQPERRLEPGGKQAARRDEALDGANRGQEGRAAQHELHGGLATQGERLTPGQFPRVDERLADHQPRAARDDDDGQLHRAVSGHEVQQRPSQSFAGTERGDGADLHPVVDEGEHRAQAQENAGGEGEDDDGEVVGGDAGGHRVGRGHGEQIVRPHSPLGHIGAHPGGHEQLRAPGLQQHHQRAQQQPQDEEPSARGHKAPLGPQGGGELVPEEAAHSHPALPRRLVDGGVGLATELVEEAVGVRGGVEGLRVCQVRGGPAVEGIERAQLVQPQGARPEPGQQRPQGVPVRASARDEGGQGRGHVSSPTGLAPGETPRGFPGRQEPWRARPPPGPRSAPPAARPAVALPRAPARRRARGSRG
ncbi:cyanogen bromide [Stigmatella aurantiaca DW4/3-1]|uniref:Cyanogen bromide n=1 Tax=Stigmatella aurantiaca (strain DW4/3-1) TaxID=378806 RepID=Q093M6_STIAD|nr:cyanogen bromide [Stigmatella aurantiaca DW4/3-1]